MVVGGVPGKPGSRWHSTYEKACAGPSFSLERRYIYQTLFELCECATAARSMCHQKGMSKSQKQLFSLST